MWTEDSLSNIGRRHGSRIAGHHRWLLMTMLFVALLTSLSNRLASTGNADAASTTSGAARTTPGGSAVVQSNWTVYHGQPTGTGIATSPTPLSPLRGAWSSRVLDGDLYGEPLVLHNRIIVATENDTVYALSARDGHVLWRRHLGSPVSASHLPCGDIEPTVGITGTPVIDATRGEVFVVADVNDARRAHHVLFGIDVGTGGIRLQQGMDPPGSDPEAQLQRTGLTLDEGQVVFGYGGNYGDCGTYHGWVVAVPESGGRPRMFEVDPRSGEHEGAVWMGGAAPEVDSHGNIWLATGNGSVTDSNGPYDGSDAVLELSSQLRMKQYFTPASWAEDNVTDSDLGSASPALLLSGQVVQAGKSGVAYLLNGSNLGGIGGQQAETTACNGEVDGGPVVQGNTTYLPCGDGALAVHSSATPPQVGITWRAGQVLSGMVADGNHIFGVNPVEGDLVSLFTSNGRVDQRFRIGNIANHFATPTAADGLVLAASARTVHAYAGPRGLPPPSLGH